MQKKVTNKLVGLRKVQRTNWAAIWRRWLRDEGRLTKWRAHLQAEGYSSWSEWRRAVVVKPFGLSRRQWTLYEVNDPRIISTWLGGPFPRWIAGPYRGAQSRTFGWLAASKRSTEEPKTSLHKSLPKKIFMFGLLYRGRVYVLDGMHRSIALAKHLRQGRIISSKITLALAKTNKLPKLDRSLQ